MPTSNATLSLYWLWIFIGGGFGSCVRYGITRLVQEALGTPIWTATTLPWGTMTVNVLGCFIIGLLAGLANGHSTLPSSIRFGFITGFLGGFTTFSTFAYETFLLSQQGHSLKPFINISISVLLGIAAVFAGFYITRYALNIR